MIENLLAPFVPGFQNRYPGVEVHLLEAAATRLQSHVDRGDVQLGILPSGHDALLGELLYPIHVTVAVAQKHPFARRPTLEIVELADKPLLLLNRQFGLRSWFEATCEVAHIRPRMLLESSAPHTLTALASEGYGIAVVPSDVRITGVNVRLVPLMHRGTPVGRWAIVAWDPRRFLAPYIAQFVKELVASVRRSFPGRDVIRRVPPLPRPKS